MTLRRDRSQLMKSRGRGVAIFVKRQSNLIINRFESSSYFEEITITIQQKNACIFYLSYIYI
jgi:hypothetical protein